MTLVNAALRPSGASYRDNLIAGIPNKNPSKEIDELLAANNGYLVYQEDIIRFLQEICGLSGSEADNIRRGIAHKEEKRLQEAMPKILEGYCVKSSHPREQAEQEAKTFIQIIKDASSYMFGRNHATGYSMVGYKCVFFRTYFPAEFIIGYLNAAKSNDDIVKGDTLADELDISYLNDPVVKKRKAEIISAYSGRHVTADDIPDIPRKIVVYRPTFGKSKGRYTFDPENYAIYKGVGSIKGLNASASDELYELAQKPEYKNLENMSAAEKRVAFYHLIVDCLLNTSIKKNNLKSLIELNFFHEFGGDATLLRIYDTLGALTGDFKFATLHNKSFKKAELPFLDLDLDVLISLPHNETEKMLRGFDMDLYFTKVFSAYKDESLPLKQRLETEKEATGGTYLTRINSRSPYYYIMEMRTYDRKNNPYFTLFNLKTGLIERCSVSDARYYINNTIQQGDVITNCKFEKVRKKKKVDGQYIETDQYKTILKSWTKPKKFN